MQAGLYNAGLLAETLLLCWFKPFYFNINTLVMSNLISILKFPKLYICTVFNPDTFIKSNY